MIRFSVIRIQRPSLTIEDVGDLFDIEFRFPPNAQGPPIIDSYKNMKLVEVTETGSKNSLFIGNLVFTDNPKEYWNILGQNKACVYDAEYTQYYSSITIDPNNGLSFKVQI